MCNCGLCQRNADAEARLALLPESERAYWDGIYLALLTAEMDRDWHAAVIDGSWPDADRIIRQARWPRYELTDKGRELLGGGE